MFENLKEVYEKYKLEQLHPFCDLLVDDGVENKGAVDEGIINEPLFINKLIAQKDVIFSNSMIEAVNKRLKMNSFTPKNILISMNCKGILKI